MERVPRESVVITGCGWVTPFASGSISEVLTAARDRPPQVPDDSGYLAIPDGVGDDWPNLTPELKSDHGALMTAVALEHSRRDASLKPESYPSERVGMVLGCALAGQLGMIQFANEVRSQSPRFVSPIHFPQTVGNYISGALARAYDIRGPVFTIACGPASGLDAIVEGARLVATERADLVIAGGTEHLSPELAQGLGGPGVPLSEGACLFVLEREDRAAERGANVLATISPARPGASGEQPSRAGRVVRSGTAVGEPGTIAIEHWVGQCFAALGAAAVAAGIGGSRGLDVPTVASIDPASVDVGPMGVAKIPANEEAVPVLVLADTDRGDRTTLEIAVRRPK